MSTVIEARHISKTFGSGKTACTALHDVNFVVAKGESVAIIGKSGSGKSTLMHQLALLDTPSEGELYIDAKLSTGMSEKVLNRLRNEHFGFVFQQFFLNGNDSVINNVMLPLLVAGMSNSQRTKRAMEVLAQVDLSDKADSRAADLSGGQKQRVCIARALVNQPSIIFADEPTGNLDSVTGEAISNLLFKLNAEQGITLIIVTHDTDLAARCSRQLHIKDGQLVEAA
jgi:putative ABC transport system ATP-binding protein